VSREEPYELGTAPPARRAIADRLPAGVAAAAVEFITGPLLDNPHRVGRPLREELSGIYSARLGRDWCVMYEIDEAKRVVIVLDIRHRSVAYRAHR
jgi:mRNA interferase RelE/StbE